jgi:putative endonuclease
LGEALKRRDTGNIGELLARDYLKKKGYRILETNYRCRAGEIDIIALDRGSLCFVEVRAKINLDFGTPEESITTLKKEHMTRAAFQYLQEHPGLSSSWRIDMVALELDAHNRVKRIELIENAIEE